MHDVDKSDFCMRQGAKYFLVVNWTKKHSSLKISWCKECSRTSGFERYHRTIKLTTKAYLWPQLDCTGSFKTLWHSIHLYRFSNPPDTNSITLLELDICPIVPYIHQLSKVRLIRVKPKPKIIHDQFDAIFTGNPRSQSSFYLMLRYLR